MNKIVIIADSLSLPRPAELGNVPYKDTYPCILDFYFRNKYGKNAPIVIGKGKRARTVTQVLNDWNEDVSFIKPEIVIVHVGIVDCAPRIFLPKQQAFIERIKSPWLKSIILELIKKNRRKIISCFPNRVYTPLSIYRESIHKLVELAKKDNVNKLIFINTVSPPDDIEYRSPGFKENVRLYNKTLDEVRLNDLVSIVDLDEILHREGCLEKYVLDDGYHLSIEGNKVVANQLGNLLFDVVNNSLGNNLNLIEGVG